jgi:hypothetical protein
VDDTTVVSASVIAGIEPALSSGTPVLVTDCPRPERPLARARPPIASLIAAPPPHDDDRGVATVVVGRDRGRSPFTQLDRDQLESYAHLVKELFATSRGLLGAAQQLDHSVLRGRFIGFVDTPDDTTARVCSTVFQTRVALPTATSRVSAWVAR